MRDWFRLDWTVPPQGADAWAAKLIERAALLLRGFEAALEDGAQAGEINLGAIGDELARWDRAVLAVFQYTEMGENRPIPTETGRLVAELRAAWAKIAGLREQVLARLGPEAAARIVQREVAAPAGRSLFRERQAQPETPTLRRFTGEVLLAPGPSVSQPLGPEELRMRQVAENKPLPEGRRLASLLAALPSEWVGAVHEHLQVPGGAEEGETTIGSRSAAQRAGILGRLADEGFLRRLVGSLAEPERALIGAILRAGGVLSYARVAEGFGGDEGEGFYWRRRGPCGPLARLRRCGLLFVGLHRGAAVVTVPADLAGRLEALLARGASSPADG